MGATFFLSTLVDSPRFLAQASHVSLNTARAKTCFALGGILLVAAALRIWGLDYGLPHPLARPDEERLVGRAQTIFATGNWHPGSFFYPSFVFYLQTLALYLYYGLQKLAGHYERPFDFLFAIAVTRPGLHYWICRWVSVLAGVATVAATYRLGVTAYDRRSIGLLAALFLASAHVHVRDSHFATVDIPVTLFVTLSLVFALRASKQLRMLDFALAGVFGGLAASSKYNAGLVALAFVAAAGLALIEDRMSWSAPIRRALLGGVSAAAAFALTSPYVVTHFPGFWNDMMSLRQFLYRPEGELALWQHLRTTFPAGIGWPLFAAGLVGVGRALWKRRTADLVLLVFLVPFLFLLSGVRITFPRYVLPVLPVLLVLAAETATVLFDRLSFRSWWVKASVGTALLALAITPSFANALRFDRVAARADTRVLASRWIAENVAPRTRILVCSGYGAPVINEDRRRPPAYVVEELDCRRPLDLEGSGASYLVTHEHEELSGFSRIDPSLGSWLGENAKLAVRLSPYRRGADGNPVFYPSDAFYIPFAGFEAVTRGGPLVRIWRLPDS